MHNSFILQFPHLCFESIKSDGEEILSIPSHSLLAVEKQIDKDDDVDSSGEAGHAKHLE